MSVQNASLRSRLENVIALAGLLERVEQSRKPLDAGQYRSLVEQLQHALTDDLPRSALKAVFGAYPAAAELYENMHYASAGLALAPIDLLVSTERETARLLQRLQLPTAPA